MNIANITYIRKFTKNHIFLIIMIFTGLIKTIILNKLPIFAFPTAAADDGLLYSWAVNIVNGKWLGDFNYFTLTKGSAFSIFLALCNICKIPYLLAESIIYSLGCILITWAVKDIFKYRVCKYIFYLLLLINPISFALYTFQKVYRNGIILGLELIVISLYLYIYLHYEKRKKLNIFYVFFAAIAYPFMRYSRDDSIWIIPFMICASIVIIIKTYLRYRNIKKIIFLTMILILPFITAFQLKTIISYENYTHYGIYTVTDASNTNFAKSLDVIYSIEDNSNLQRVSVSREKMLKLYECSPTLTSIQDLLNNQIAAWRRMGRNVESGEIEGTLFYWAYRQTVGMEGYYETGQRSEEFYGKVYDELKMAIDSGVLNTQWTMPSIFMTPWKDGYGKLLIEEIIHANKYIVTFQALEVAGSTMPETNSTDQEVKEMAEFCYSNAIYGDESTNIDYKNKADNLAHYLNGIVRIYQTINPVIWLMSVISFLTLSINNIIFIKKNRFMIHQEVLILVSIVLCIVLIIGGVSYIEISDYEAINYMYLSPAYPLMAIFEGIAVLRILEMIFSKKLWSKGSVSDGVDHFDALP